MPVKWLRIKYGTAFHARQGANRLFVCGKRFTGKYSISLGDTPPCQAHPSRCAKCLGALGLLAGPRLFYILNTSHVVGNCALWWREGGHGYTCDLGWAWKLEEAAAKEICRSRPKQDVAYPCDVVDAKAQMHVDVQSLPAVKW